MPEVPVLPRVQWTYGRQQSGFGTAAKERKSRLW
jgi:hypothetical protein